MKTIQVNGNSVMDRDLRFNKLTIINQFDTATLIALANLLQTEKARTKFKSKATFLKNFI